MAPLGPEEEGAGRQNRADGESDRDQRSDPQPEAQHEPDQGQTRTQLGQLIKRIVVGIVVTALVAVGAYKTLSQKRSPSGAKEATPIGPPPIPGLGEITVTCSPTLQTARGNVFSAAWDIPGALLGLLHQDQVDQKPRHAQVKKDDQGVKEVHTPTTLARSEGRVHPGAV